MTVRSDALVLTAWAGAAAGTTLATVPAGEVWILKDFSIRNTSTTTAAVVRLSVRRTAIDYAFHRVPIAAEGVVSSTERFIVLEPGDVLRAHADITATFTLCVGGARLVLP